MLLILPGPGRAQVNDSLTTTYHQELDTRLWRLQELVRVEQPEYSFQSSGYGALTQRRLSGYESQWKNDFNASLDLSRRVSDHLNAVLEMSGQDFRDREAPFILDRGSGGSIPVDYNVNGAEISQSPLGQNSRIARGSTRTGLEYTPNPGFEGTMLVGGAYDDQLRGSGEGFSGSGEFYWSNVLDSGMDLQSDNWINQYGSRQNHSIFARGLTLNQFGDAINQLAASWINRRSDLFFGSGGQIVSRVSEEIQLDNQLSAPLYPNLNGVYSLSYRRSTVDYRGGGPGPGDEMDLINQLSIQGMWRRWLGRLSYHYSLEDRTYGTLILGRNQMLSLDVSRVRDEDSLAFRLSTEKWSYDSPDSLETSDRDRLIHRFGSNLSLRVFEQAQLSVSTLVLLDHVVNLDRDRSAENRWNRVFRLSPGVEWTPRSGWRNRAIFEVLANYTDYDFDEQTGTIRSNVFRRWSAADTINVPLPLELKAELSGRLDLEDRGRLRWSEFVQEVSDEKRAWFWSLSLARTFWNHFRLKAGYQTQRREEDSFTPAPDNGRVRSRIDTYEVHGPFFRAETLAVRELRIAVEVVLQDVNDNPSSGGRDRLDRVEAALAYRW